MIFSKIVCPRSRWLRWHFVSKVNDYTPIHHWLRGPFLKTLQVSHRFQRNMQAKKKFGCVYTANSNNLKIWKPAHLKKNSGIRVVVDYGTPDFRSLRPNIFAKTKNFAKPFLTVHMGSRSNLLSQKNCLKSRDTVPLKGVCHMIFNLHFSWFEPIWATE